MWILRLRAGWPRGARGGRGAGWGDGLLVVVVVLMLVVLRAVAASMLVGAGMDAAASRRISAGGSRGMNGGDAVLVVLTDSKGIVWRFGPDGLLTIGIV